MVGNFGSSGDGIVAFCLFPVEAGDSRWRNYLERIGSELGVTLSEQEHTSRVSVPLQDGHHADIVLATFGVPKAVRTQSRRTRS